MSLDAPADSRDAGADVCPTASLWRADLTGEGATERQGTDASSDRLFLQNDLSRRKGCSTK
jgi:hypothetical protein